MSKTSRSSAKTACLVLIGLITVSACKSIPEGPMGEELRNGNLGVTVTGYELRYLDIEAESGAIQTTSDPILLVFLTLTNHGTTPIRYDTRDAATTAQQAVTPVLFVDPGEDGELSQENNVAVVSLGQFRYLGDPITGAETILPGTTVEDVLLFEQPPAATTKLRLSLPPTMFGPAVELPAWINIPYTAVEAITLPVVAQGEVIEGDGYRFQVNRSEVSYLPNRDRSGFVEQPVFSVWYTIENATEEALTYQPPHRNANGETTPSLTAGSTVYSRVLVPAHQGLADQVWQNQELAPGQTLNDYAVFERPPTDISEVQFFFKGHALGRTGQVRIQLPYVFLDPPLPEELQTPAPPAPPTPEGEQPETP